MISEKALLLRKIMIKYPRTPHLPWSEGMTSDDKKILTLNHFLGRNVIVTEKMDGENTTMYRDNIHARSLDSRGGEDRTWVKNFWSTFSYKIPENYRICGENLWAKHSIYYQDLKSYFYGFSVWNENLCLSWEETELFFEDLGIHSVPVLYKGIWNEDLFLNLSNDLDLEEKEGYVVRLADEFMYEEFENYVAKFVRKNHVQTAEHWRSSIIVPNRLTVDEVAREATTSEEKSATV
jgi:hypothetical protein